MHPVNGWPSKVAPVSYRRYWRLGKYMPISLAQMDTVSERLGDVLSQCHTHAHFAAFLPVPPAPINQSINQSSPSIFVDGAFSSFSLSLRRIPTDIVRCTGEFVRFWTLQISARRSWLARASAFPTSTMGRCGHYCMSWSTKSTPQNVSVRCSNFVSTK